MKILTGEQIKQAEHYTMVNEPISSLALMERASAAMAKEIEKHINPCTPLLFFIGKGNNGGDGLVIARMLSQKGYQCSVYCLFESSQLTHECKEALSCLPDSVKRLSGDFTIPCDAVIIDCLLGTGVRGRVTQPIAAIIERINNCPNIVIAIDLPSGMSTEWQAQDSLIVDADYTLAIEFPKLAMLLPEAGEHCGQITIVPIGLSKTYIEQASSDYYYSERGDIRSLLQSRHKFAYKNNYGHTLLICGSKNMSGAAILATGAALRSGCGLVTTHVPYGERYGIMAHYPSAMLSFDDGDCFSTMPTNPDKYDSIVIGCGLGQSAITLTALRLLLSQMTCPMVLDADALNIIASNPELKQYIPANSILTPHVGELKRLVGSWQGELDKLVKVRQLAINLRSVVLLKGAYTAMCTPNGQYYFNSTGNAGMAKGGSGDVLAGLLGGLLARGYHSENAAKIGVYLHGLAGDLAALALSQEAMNSHDIIEYLPLVFKTLCE